MKMKLQLTLIAILLSTAAMADGYYPEAMAHQPWSVQASLGAGKYDQMHHKSSKTTLGRLALGNELMLTGDLAWGVEMGLQNGNRMHLILPNTTLEALKWLPVQTNLRSMLDLLVTAKSDPLIGSSFFAQIKAGVAYRKWQISNPDINNVSQIAGEFQAGLGYPVTTLANLNLLYQGVLGNDPNPNVNALTQTGHVANIPTLHALLLGLSVTI